MHNINKYIKDVLKHLFTIAIISAYISTLSKLDLATHSEFIRYCIIYSITAVTMVLVKLCIRMVLKMYKYNTRPSNMIDNDGIETISLIRPNRMGK